MHPIPKDAPVSEAFASVAELKAQIQIEPEDDSKDKELQALLSRVGRALQSPAGLGRSAFRRRYQILLRPRGGVRLGPPCYPVESVESLRSLAGEELSIEGVEIQPAGTAAGDLARHLYLERGWPCSPPDNSTARPTHRLDLTAGYLAVDQVADWSASQPWQAGDWVRPTEGALLRFEAASSGQTGDAEPAWPTDAGEAVIDGTLTWVARAAHELPGELTTAALLTAESWWRGDLARQADLKTFRFEESMVSFHPSARPRPIPPAAEVMLRWYQ